MKENKTILCLTRNYYRSTTAPSINTRRRKKILEQLGFKVLVFTYDKHSFLKSVLLLLPLLKKIDYLYIRIDGAEILDKFTLLKLFHWEVRIIWEIHGFPEEKLFFHRHSKISSILLMSGIKRKILSIFVDKYVFISRALQRYAKHKLVKRKQYLIPNFIEYKNNKIDKKQALPKEEILNNSSYFKVFWIGNGAIRWHALDLIEDVAKKIYTIDKTIVFFIISSNRWHPFNWRKNVIFLNSLPNDKLDRIINKADVCLALYHKSKYFPLYFFPLKILRYMLFKKPVIATNGEGIKELVIHQLNGIITNNSVENIINNLLTLKTNPKTASLLGQNAYQTIIQKYCPEVASQLYKNMFGEADFGEQN